MRLKRYKKNNNKWSVQLVLVFKKIWKFDKKLIWILFAEILISAASPFPYIVFSKYIIDGLVNGEDYHQVLLYICLMFFINYALSVMATLVNSYKMKLSAKMTNMLANEVRKKCMDMDYSMFNDTAIQDRAMYATRLAEDNNFVNILNGIKGLVSNAIILAGVIFVVIQVDIFLLFVALFVITAQCAVYFINTKSNIKYDVEGSTVSRCLQYLTQISMKTKIKKDISIYNISSFILNKIHSYQKSWMKIFNKRVKTNSISEWLTNTFSFGFQLTAYILLGLKVFAKEITLGSFTMGINSLNSFVGASKGIAQSVIDINARIYSVGRYHSFLNIRSEFRKDATRKIDDIDLKNVEIKFENVYFKYPGSTSYVLKDINLTINTYEKIAVVGENGSGKTTFVMLLTRMYDPTEGRILINGIDIREIDYDSYMKLFSTVYQDFHIFPFSILENIVFRDEADEEAEKKILELFKQNGLSSRLEAMYQGLKTPITKELDNRGEDLSGGELQRIAIIRALYKNAPFIVLDEPTSALDPIAEYEIYHRFSQMTNQKTAIYISHRIASTRFCDRIVVFDKGVISELGTFDELINNQGLYYHLYQKQAQYFTNNI